jgi:hypothetical protein
MLTLSMLAPVLSFGQPARPQIVLEKQPLTAMHLENLPEQARNLARKRPDGYHFSGAATVGHPADVETLTLRFEEGLTIRSIASEPDFKIEPGGSCQEGVAYAPQAACTLLVRFTPQGPGPRLGRLTIAHSAAADFSFEPRAKTPPPWTLLRAGYFALAVSSLRKRAALL